MNHHLTESEHNATPPRGDAVHERDGRAFIRVGSTRCSLEGDELSVLEITRNDPFANTHIHEAGEILEKTA